MLEFVICRVVLNYSMDLFATQFPPLCQVMLPRPRRCGVEDNADFRNQFWIETSARIIANALDCRVAQVA